MLEIVCDVRVRLLFDGEQCVGSMQKLRLTRLVWGKAAGNLATTLHTENEATKASVRTVPRLSQHAAIVCKDLHILFRTILMTQATAYSACLSNVDKSSACFVQQTRLCLAKEKLAVHRRRNHVNLFVFLPLHRDQALTRI